MTMDNNNSDNNNSDDNDNVSLYLMNVSNYITMFN